MSSKMIRFLLPSALLSILPTACASTEMMRAQSASERARQIIDGYISSGESPGVQYAGVYKNQAAFEYSAGLSDIKNKAPMSAATTVMAYSMTKTFTAAATLLLVQDGKVELDAPVQKYVPEFPYGEKVRVRHLLAQTSGLPNPIPLRWVHLLSEHQEFSESKALEAVVKANGELSFEPGEEYAYSNLSYWYLGHLIARASGMSYEEFVKRRLLDPLGITEEEMSFQIPQPERHAKGYLKKWSFMNLFKGLVTDSKFWGEYEDGWLEILPHYPNGPAFGGLIASARGVTKFLQAQLSDTSSVINASTRRAFYERQADNRGNGVEMTLGWHIGELSGTEYFYKEGGGAGYHVEMRVYPKLGFASVILANSTTFNARKRLSECDSAYLSSGVK